LLPIPDPQFAGPLPVEVTSFHGITPGTSSRAEVEKTWGKPKAVSQEKDVTTELYSVAPFSRVEVMLTHGVVSSIIIRFDHAFSDKQVAQQLDLAKVQPVLVSNELGEILGEAYPECGVLFSFEAAKDPSQAVKKVTHIVLEPLSAEPFVLRAETNLDSRPVFSLHDTDAALKLQPRNARADWLRSRALMSLGQYEKAVAAATEAAALDPNDAWYPVTLAQALGLAGHVQEAIAKAQEAIPLSGPRPHIKARALCLMGDFKACGPEADFKQALQYHAQAIQTAEGPAGSRHPAIRVAAKEVLIDAHLGAAHDVAWGHWSQKERSVQSWLGKAAVIVDDLVKNDNGDEQCRFRFATHALGADVGLQGHLDPAAWTEQLLRAGDALIAATPESARKSQLQWEMAVALYDALQIYQMRADHPAALKYGELAIGYLEHSGRESQSATTSYLLGRLNFRIGAVYAVNLHDHATAVTWFEKAVPFLGKPLPDEAVADLGRLGDTFVSMGVSYWSIGRQQKALALTRHGADLMEEAVHRGTYARTALAVPYANLATMHREMGNVKQAHQLEEMAARVKSSQTR
jgi:tetratricopeptide (TPR) repeat protein